MLAGGSAAGFAATRPPSHDYGIVPASGAMSVAPVSSGARPSDGARVTTSPVTGSAPGGARPAVTVTHVPTRLRIPAIGVNARVIPVGVQAGGGLAIPPDPSVVGWWAGGASPGEPTGAVILAGHINSAVLGPGALLRLQDARPGEGVTIVAGRHAYRYRIAALRAYAKADLRPGIIFGQRVTARLVIVSCGGPFDPATGHYLDNIVAYAVPDGAG